MSKSKSILTSAIIFFIALTIFGIFKFSAYEHKRDIDKWRITLDVLADSKAQNVNNWLDSHRASLVTLAENPSLQIYTQHLSKNRKDPAQQASLNNLIESTAIRTGFTRAVAKQTIKTTAIFQEDQSLALYATDLSLLAATKDTLPLTDNFRIDMENSLESGQVTLLNLEKRPGMSPAISFLIPVYGLQQGAEGKPVGILHGRLSPTTSLFPLLTDQTNSMGNSVETYLIQLNGQLTTYISPLKNSPYPLLKQLAGNDLTLVATQAIKQPDTFGSGFDYAGEQVIFTSRAMKSLDWYLIQKISKDEALEESQQHSRMIIWISLLLLILILSIISVAWKHGVSTRQQQATTLLRAKTEELSKQTNLFNSISDNITDLILLVDEQENILFINQAFARLSKDSFATMENKKLSRLIGPDPAEALHNFYAHSKQVHHKHLSLHLNNCQYEFLATAVTINYGNTGATAHLISLHDITKLNAKLRQNENLMQQTIQALMRAIDLHDPYSANHSAKTADLVQEIAISMNLSNYDQHGILIAATLCNLGKLSIPGELLSKTGKLSLEEKELLGQETTFAAEILSDVDFSWPVAETIRLKTEYLDGSGTPLGLSGEEINMKGRILATANSFIAMTSPRPYREKFSNKDALNQLLELSDTLYDRRVVAALFNIIENKSE